MRQHQSTRKGSTKIMTAARPGEINVFYTKGWSAFDRGTSRQIIPGIDTARCSCAVKSFELAHKAGLPTHFLRRVSPRSFHVEEYGVPGRESLSGETSGRVLPLEWIWRAYAMGSLLERIRSGKVDPVSLGFERGVEVKSGMKLPRLVLECTTKFEPTDRHLTDEEARDLAKLSLAEWDEAQRLLIRGVAVSNVQFERAGFIPADGKMELGQAHNGRIVIVDVFGTQDENRLIDQKSGDIYSKDIIRVHLKELPWYAELAAAKAAYPDDKQKWPPYPSLPARLVEMVVRRYAEVARRYTA